MDGKGDLLQGRKIESGDYIYVRDILGKILNETKESMEKEDKEVEWIVGGDDNARTGSREHWRIESRKGEEING